MSFAHRIFFVGMTLTLRKIWSKLLTDHNILTKITATAELSEQVNVIEIG